MTDATSVLDIVAVRSGHFELESGYHTDSWFELDDLFTKPAELRPFVSLLAEKLSGYRFDAVCGPMTGGAFLAQMVANELAADFCWAEPYQSDRVGLFTVDYRIPAAIQNAVAGRTVALVDDAISAGSSVRATFAELDAIGAQPIVLGALLVFGPAADELARSRRIPLERVADLPLQTWLPAECPLCAASTPLERLR